MAEHTSDLDSDDGTLTLDTGVSGPAAKMGHRLTIELTSWRAKIDWDGQRPVGASVVVDIDSLRVVSGAGGVGPLTAPEKALVRSNALKTLAVKRFPTAEFQVQVITPDEGGYVLSGPLTVRGVTRTVEWHLGVTERDGAHRLRVDAEVSHGDHKIKQYSMAMGAMKVADPVRVTFEGRHPES